MVHLLKWDTDNFGIKVGKLILEECNKDYLYAELSKAKEDGFNLLYIKGVALPEDWLNENIKLADEKVVYSQTLSRTDRNVDTAVVSGFGTPISEELYQLSFESGKYSRYKLDKKLPGHIFKTLYSLWIKRSLNGAIADDVLLYKDGSKAVGMLTYKIESDHVEIGLVAVNPSYAGKGIGTKMMQTLFSKFPLGAKISVATQKKNKAACHYYEKNGFEVESVTNIYHVWI